MNKSTIALGLLLCATFAHAQKGKFIKTDTIKVQQIEDINLHKTGNPNKAKPLSTKSNLTVMETPQPIAIVTHEIIEQQQAKQLSDVLQNVNGIYVTSSRGNSQDSFGGRGFSLGNDNIFKNGARVNSGVFPEVSGLERVEVLKGANAMLYGNTAAGGVINMVTKKPRFQTGGSISLNGGSWNTYKPTFDVYGPISKDVAFRLNGTYETADSFRDGVSSEKIYFNPSLLFNIGKKSQLIVEGDYLINNFTPDFGIGAITNKDGSYAMNNLLPRNAFLGANWQYQDVKQASTDIIFNHQFSNRWTLNSVLSYQNYTRDYYSTERVQWGYDKNGRLKWDRPLNKQYTEQNYTSFQININGEFNTGSLKHQVLIGTDGDYNQADTYTFNNPTKYGTNGNTNDPSVYLDDPSTWTSGNIIPPASKNTRSRIPTYRYGVYIQDFISITNQFKVLAGVRWSYIENKVTQTKNFVTNSDPRPTGTATSDHAFSPKFGLVYTPNENLSVFATYTNSFSANTGYTVDGIQNLDPNLSNNDFVNKVRALPRVALTPTTIDQYEIGIKKNLWNNAIAVNLSIYQILYKNYYQNVLDKNGASIDTDLKEFAGKMRSRGVELDITGNPSKNLSLIGGISYNNSVYLDTPDTFGYVENQRIVRTPATTANLSAFYTLPKYIKGLKVGASFYYIGDRLAGWNDTKATNNTRNGVSRIFTLKDYTTFALSLGYDWKKFSIQAKVNNLFDTVNYNVHENYSVNPIAPRNYYFTLTYRL